MNELVGALTSGLPESIEQMGDIERGQWLLAQLLNWHRREAKSFWWRYFYSSMNSRTRSDLMSRTRWPC